MSERWRRALGRLDREEPDESALRARAEEGPRMPEPQASRGSRIVAAAAALLLAVGGTTLAVRAFRSDGTTTPASAVDPAAVCGFTPRHGPEYVSLDGVEVRQAVLDEPGVPYEELPAEVLGAEPPITHGPPPGIGPAPENGWRVIDQHPDGATVAAPDGNDWYVLRIDRSDGTTRVGGWAPNAEVLPTAADRGAGLRLAWDGPAEIRQGSDAEPTLFGENDGAEAWVDDRGQYWGIVHVLDPATGRELPSREGAVNDIGREYDVPPGGRFDVPIVSVTPFASLDPGTYDLVACVANLSLVSPIGELRVVADDPPSPVTSEPPTPTPTATAVSILVATQTQGPSMAALAEGTLRVADGCLALGTGDHPSFVIWPAGSTLLTGDLESRVVDAEGNTIAQLGAYVHLGGGFIGLSQAQNFVDGEIPASCTVTGERYFLASGVETSGQAAHAKDVTSPLGFALTVPESWSVQHIDAFNGRVSTQGVVVSSVPLPAPAGEADLPDLSALAPGEVVLAILHTEGGALQPFGPDTPLPLRWDDFDGIPKDAGFSSSRSFILNETAYNALIGGASDGTTVHDADLRAIVASIRPASG